MRPPPRRSHRLSATAAAAEPPRTPRKSGGRLSVTHRRAEQLKPERLRHGGAASADDDDDGLPLSDEALLLVFTALASSATADLVRCAATCRRWRRLVSVDAAFICRGGGAPPRSDPFIRGLALGFFHFRTADVQTPAPPRFVPFSSAAAATRYHLPSFAEVAGGASRVVASRNGYVVVDLLRVAKARSTHAVRLGVCNPVIAGGGGAVDVVPPLRGKDSPTGPYTCTVITAADDELGHTETRRVHGDHSWYLVILLYNRRRFTAVRCYSSATGSWGPETEVTGARIGRTHLAGGGLMHAAVVHRGVVFWPRLAVGLPVNSLLHPTPAVTVTTKNNGATTKTRHTIAGFSSEEQQQHHHRWWMSPERLVGVTPDGRVLKVEADGETIRAYCGSVTKKKKMEEREDDNGGGWCSRLGTTLQWKWTLMQALVRVHSVTLRWMGEKSGLVLFTAENWDGPGTHVYTLDVETKEVTMMATAGGESPPVGEVCGYEMDRVTLLASLGR
ncbi:hypothetical protein QOZ80_8BG0645670 [Eleusine coracana subsp. coracana]|nr:hypothetical protein QOZ80_8BG0645670 [Eleusine coracana subsp. coracana]